MGKVLINVSSQILRVDFLFSLDRVLKNICKQTLHLVNSKIHIL